MPSYKTDPEDRSQRQKQKDHGAQSDQGDAPLATAAPEPAPDAYEGGEESHQQRRA
jgi:hypothetical protein